MSLFTLQPAPHPRWPIGLQAGLGIALPIAIMTLAGRPELGFAAATGTFTILYAGGRRTVERARVLPFVAAGLSLCAALGALAGAGGTWAVAVGTVAIALLGASAAYAWSLGPPGPLFFVLVFGLTAYVTSTTPMAPLAFVLAVVAGCVFSFAIAMTPLVLPRVRAASARPLRELLPGPRLDGPARLLLARAAIVAVAGVGIGLVLDPARGYWIVGAGLAVVGVAADRRAAFSRGLHRMAGTLVGAGAYSLLALLHPAGLWLALLLGVLQFAIELVVVRNYALALVFITPLVLLLTGAATGDLGSASAALERIVDTIAGSLLGALTGVLHPRAPRPGPA